MDRERLDGWCEKAILGLVLAVLIIGPLATGAVRAQDFLILQWLTVVTLAVWMIRFWVNPKHRLLWPPLCWAVLAFMLYAVGRYFHADVEFLARQEMIRVVIYGFLFFAIINNLHRLETTQIVTLTLITLATAISMYAVIQFLADSNRVWTFIRPEVYSKRGSGSYICPNHLAGFLEMILPISLSYTLTGRFKYLSKILLGYASLVIFTGITVSLSRGGWVATAVVLIIFFCWMLRQRDYRLQAVVLLTAFLTIGAIFLWKVEWSQNRKDGFEAVAKAEDFRFRLWAPAALMWQDNFWWGVGPAHFDYRFRQYRPSHFETQIRPDRVHNDYLNTLTDWGLVGGVLVSLAWILFFYGVARAWKFVQRSPNDLASKRSNKSSFVMGATLGLVAILVHSFFDFNMHVPANALLAVALLGLVAGHFRFATEGHWVTLRLPLRILVSIVLLAGVIYLGQQSWRRSAEVSSLLAANSHKKHPPTQISHLERAFRIESQNFETAYRIGEAYRLQSWAGGDDYVSLANKALTWFELAMRLNRWDPNSVLRYGMCLDWVDRIEEANPYFVKAFQLDPNGYYTLSMVGWHHVQREDFQTAKGWFERSLRLMWVNNPIAYSYHNITQQRLAEQKRALLPPVLGTAE